MTRTFEELLVEQCAPTLAGIKPASLFRYRGGGRRQALETAARWRRELAPFGVTLRVLKSCPVTGACLLYLYREADLRRTLEEGAVAAFLAGEGYRGDLEEMLRRLARRFCLEAEFPHEIGVFLGYPLEDVVGFIAHRGRDFTCCGCWKAYGDPEAARRRFARYRSCTASYLERLRRGTAVTGLIAA